MKKITIEITKEFFQKYREYKIDLVMDKCKIDMNYEMFRHVLEEAGIKYSKIAEELMDNDTITISSDGKLDSRNSAKEAAKQMERMQTMMGAFKSK